MQINQNRFSVCLVATLSLRKKCRVLQKELKVCDQENGNGQHATDSNHIIMNAKKPLEAESRLVSQKLFTD
jgi:hypothetical protein